MRDSDSPCSADAAGWWRYWRAIEHAGDGYFVVDTKFRILEVNDRLCAMFGYARDELIGCSSLDFVAPQSRAVVLRRRQIADQVDRGQYRIETRRRDGSVFPALVRAVTHRSPDGQILGSVGFVTDLSEIEQAQQTLAASERELRSILDNMQDTYYRADLEGRIVRASKSAEKLLGYPLEQLIGRRLADLYYDPTERETFLRTLEANGGAVRQFESRLRRSDGTAIWVSTNAHYYRDASGRIAGVEGTTRDITEARQLRDQLRLAACVFECATEGVVIADRDLVILRANPAFTELTGSDAGQAAGRNICEFACNPAGSDLHGALREALAASGHWSGEVRIRRRNDCDGVAGWLSVLTVRNDAGLPVHCVATFSEVTERRISRARMAYLAHHDPLTGLPNRLLLRDRIEQAIVRATRSDTKVGVLFVDLDHFKRVNDTFGHRTGDALLREIGQRLPQCVRDTDTVSRYGGDEFVVVLPDLAEAGVVERVARCISDCVSAPWRAEGVEVGVSCSIGVALYPRDGADFDALLLRADQSMYEGRRTARGAG